LVFSWLDGAAQLYSRKNAICRKGGILWLLTEDIGVSGVEYERNSTPEAQICRRGPAISGIFASAVTDHPGSFTTLPLPFHCAPEGGNFTQMVGAKMAEAPGSAHVLISKYGDHLPLYRQVAREQQPSPRSSARQNSMGLIRSSISAPCSVPSPSTP